MTVSNTLAANRGAVPSSAWSLAGTFTGRRHHYAHPAGDISDLQTVDVAYFFSAGALTNSSVVMIKRFIEYPAGVFYPVTWGGATSVTIQPGAQVVSDPVAGLTIPKGAKFWERTVSLQTTQFFPVILLPANFTTLGIDDALGGGDLGNSGSVVPSAINATIGSVAIFGTVNAVPDAVRSFVLLGDAPTYGTGDDTSVGVKGGSGWLERLLDKPGYPYVNTAMGAQSAQQFQFQLAKVNTILAVFGFTDVVVSFGLEDLRTGGVISDILNLYGNIFIQPNIANKYVWQTTIGPFTSSTDSWATVANQTPRTDSNLSQLTSLNALIRAKRPGVDEVLDLADASMSARDSLKHIAPPAGTSNGRDFNSTRAEFIAAHLVGHLITDRFDMAALGNFAANGDTKSQISATWSAQSDVAFAAIVKTALRLNLVGQTNLTFSGRGLWNSIPDNPSIWTEVNP
ncbi:hypothetical protein [Rhizobium favelukesii]|uniref:Conserved protein n=1 Tax=Rhizobium favelukesii TaxID=348824 RepID=W6R7W1_9HYPH|nr:hypothetical protein [Rhizobium favelukesii]MCS0459323.1 hypothetical protein [Rhizobium favelukesii]CDM57377.1 putative conserved protein [Rhizobium favelukesii]